jgi:hypothetical protein
MDDGSKSFIIIARLNGLERDYLETSYSTGIPRSVAEPCGPGDMRSYIAFAHECAVCRKVQRGLTGLSPHATLRLNGIEGNSRVSVPAREPQVGGIGVGHR